MYTHTHTHTHTPMTKEQTEKSASVTKCCHCCKYTLHTSEKNHHCTGQWLWAHLVWARKRMCL